MERFSPKRTAFMIMGFTLLSYLLGFARESYISFRFGATGLTDAFYVASEVPDMSASIVADALTNAFVPVLKKEKHISDGSPQVLTDVLVFYASLFSILLVVIGYMLRGQIIHLLAPGFSPAASATAKELLTIMAVSILFAAMSGVLWGVYNANERYLFPSIIGVVSNSLMLITIAMMWRKAGILALGYGLTVGIFGKFIVQFIPLLIRKQVRFPRQFWHPAIKDILGLVPPTLISTGLGTLNLVVDRMLASILPGGQLTDLNFASKVGLIPSGLIGASIATTLYTRFVTLTLDNEISALRSLMLHTLRLIVFLGIVLGTCFVFFRVDIINLLYHHGAFSYSDVLLASKPILIYGIFMTFYLMQPIMIRFFYARQANRFVMYGGLLAVSANIIVSVLLVHPLGIVGLAIGNSVSQLVLVIYLLIAMTRKLKWRIIRMVRGVLVKSVPPALSFIGGCLIVSFVWHRPDTATLVWQLARDATQIVGGIVILELLMWPINRRFRFL